ncbi:unnamed protein product [Amoebophrya sp. A120]|nr:unnamed protein product [Amoebophrya sp. A120]|eukprot:GSA120T00025999001.1
MTSSSMSSSSSSASPSPPRPPNGRGAVAGGASQISSGSPPNGSTTAGAKNLDVDVSRPSGLVPPTDLQTGTSSSSTAPQTLLEVQKTVTVDREDLADLLKFPHYDTGTPVWIPDDAHGYIPGKAVEPTNQQTGMLLVKPVEIDKDTGREVVGVAGKDDGSCAVENKLYHARDQVRARPDPFVSKEDCTSLTHLDDANILENLRRRYFAGDIYTFTSSVLLAVNPYRDVSHLYTTELKRKYVNIGSAHTLPPHPYSLADMAYRQLQISGNQAMVISGESGAGKTETAKIVMSCLADRSRTGEAQASDIQNKILNGANPILESIGNATTVRNGNSSRFGKYNALCFNAVGNLVGAEVRTYLLESSRVVAFGQGERTYHVFYELLFGCDAGMREKLELDAETPYRLLYGNGHTELGNLPQFRDDTGNMKVLDDGLEGIGFTPEERLQIYQSIAGIVHLGEVEFKTVQDDKDQDVSQCTDLKHLKIGAKLCGFDSEALEEVFLTRKMMIEKKELGVFKKEIFTVPRSAQQAVATQQSLLKMLYKRIFHLICDQINKSVHGGDRQKNTKQCGILDIYGFECLQVNSFEQVCINLANERLQQFFVQNVLTAEQALYKKEGLKWEDVVLPDADPVINCISSIFMRLDDHNMQAAKNRPTTDQKFTEECHRVLGLGGIFREPKRGKNVSKENQLRMEHGFVIQHYAGEVTYQTQDFLEKNNAKLVGDAECLIRDAANPTVAKCADLSACQVGQSHFNSVARKYLRDLEALMDTLKSCSLHYIRCFKPNVKQKPTDWNGNVMLDQMRQSGTIELVQIMHDGYPHRCPFQDLADRFQKDMPEDFRQLDSRAFVDVLMQAFSEQLRWKDWTIGTTRLFLKAGKLAVLESLSAEGIGPEIADKLRRHMRKKRLKKVLWTVRACVYMKRLMKRTRSDGLRYALVKCCRVYVKLMRWYKKIRVRRSKDKISLMLNHIVPMFVQLIKLKNKAKKMIKMKNFYNLKLSRSVLLMWQDLASEERLKREEEERLAEEQRKQDEELERAYAEMLARRNKGTGGTTTAQINNKPSTTTSTIPVPNDTPTTTSSSSTHPTPHVHGTSEANPNSLSDSKITIGTPTDSTSLQDNDLNLDKISGSTLAPATHNKVAPSPSEMSVSSVPTDAGSEANKALRAEMEEFERKKAEYERKKQQDMEAGKRGNGEVETRNGTIEARKREAERRKEIQRRDQ